MTDWSDEILESFLEEVIGGKSPPDLRSRILGALKNDSAGGDVRSPSVGSESSFPPIPVLPIGDRDQRQWWSEVVSPPPVQDYSQVLREPSELDDSRWWNSGSTARSMIAVASGTAACIIAFVGLTLTWGQLKNQELENSRPLIAANPSTPNKSLSTGSREGESTALAENRPNAVEKLELNGIPFPVNDPDQPQLPESVVKNDDGSTRLDDRQIVSLIDQQFEHLWQRVAVKPAASLDDAKWLTRVGQQLLGVAPSQQQAEEFAKAENSDKRLLFVERAIRVDSFAQHWGELWAGLLVGPASEAEDSERRQGFANWLSDSISRRRPYNEIVFQLLTARGTDVRGKGTFRPESHFLIELAKQGQFHATDRIGRAFLNQNAACSRCHDGKTESDPPQTQYWSMASSLGPLVIRPIEKDVKPPLQSFVLVDRFDSPEEARSHDLFIEQKDGRLVAVGAKLPDGKVVEELSPGDRRKQFASWLRSSPQLSQATVNTVWESIMGQPLVSTLGVSEQSGYVERKELLEVLAKQFEKHDYDLPRLVGWIAASKPFGLESRAISERDWLLDDKQLAETRAMEQVFASYGRSLKPASTTELLAQVVDLQRLPAVDMKRTVLAQPLATVPSGETKSLSTHPLDPLMQAVRLHSEHLDQRQVELVEKLLASSLEWDSLVDHALLQPATDYEKSLAKQLLAANSGDRRTTLNQLLWIAQRSQAW